MTKNLRNPLEEERGRQHLRKYGVTVPDDAGIAVAGPLTIAQLNLFAHKAVLALYFEHFRRPLPSSGSFCAYWKTKEDYQRSGIPTALLEMLPSYGTLMQGRWNERETFEYRYATNVTDGLFGCIARLRRGLFIAGFAVTDAAMIAIDADADWIGPAAPSVLLSNPRFEKKH